MMIIKIGEDIISEQDFFKNSFKILPKISIINDEGVEDIELTKEFFIKIFNKNTTEELSELDWKVLRHMEQLELGIDTSLTDEEYNTLLQEKQDIRDKVNTLETQISGCNTIDEINVIKWKYQF